MILRASDAGNLALSTMAKGRPAEVTRVFPRSAYVRSGNEFVLLLWGGLRSPMTVNLRGSGGSELVRVGEKCRMSPKGVSTEMLDIRVERAETFHTPLAASSPVVLPGTAALREGIAFLKSLYDVSPGPTLSEDRALRRFVRGTLSRFAAGDDTELFEPSSYQGLLGRGGGFTPAGDDFVDGYATTYNHIARKSRSRRILLPRRWLYSKTIPESAAILWYGTKGHVDEGLGRLTLRTLDGSARSFGEELAAVARRGHTSGLDISLGVLMCEAAISSKEGSDALSACSSILWP